MIEFLIGFIVGATAAAVGVVHVVRRYQERGGRIGEFVRLVLYK